MRLDAEVLSLELLDDGMATISMFSLLPSKSRDSVGSNGFSLGSWATPQPPYFDTIVLVTASQSRHLNCHLDPKRVIF